MNIFRNAILNNIANNILLAFFELARRTLILARLLNGLCFVLASMGLLGFAVLLVRHFGDRIPACDALAFLVAWWAFAMANAGCERIMRCRPRALPKYPPVAREVPVSHTAFPITAVRRQASKV